jgi:hypothetical protein
MIVTQRIGTDVPVAIPLDVYIRELEHDSRENREYVFVGTTERPNPDPVSSPES